MAKKSTRRQRKDARHKAQRAGRPGPGPARPAAHGASSPARLVAADRTADEADDRRAPVSRTRNADRAPRSARAPAKKGRRGRAERALLVFAGLVAVAGLITYLAMNRTPAPKMVPEGGGPEAKGPATAQASPVSAPAVVTAPPVDLSPPTIVAPATAVPSASASARTVEAGAKVQPKATPSSVKPRAAADPY